MKLDDISEKLKLRLSNPLPGAAAHEPMRAVPIGNLKLKFDHTAPPRPGGVLIMLYQEGDLIKFPLIRRTDYSGVHGGQISLPGGKSEAGENAVEAALREAEEEIGIDKRLPQVLGTLSDFLVIPSNFMVTPVVAVFRGAPVFRPDPREVAGILSGSIEALMMDNAIRQQEILAGGQFRMIAPHFEVDLAVVWGATAMMLNEFRIVLRETLKM